MYRSGYPLAAVNQVDVQMTSKAASPGHKGSPLLSGPALCEDGRPYVTDPVTGRQICMCNLGTDTHYVSRGLVPPEARKHGALPGAAGAPSLGFDTSAFYSPLIRSLPFRQERLPPYLNSGVPGQPIPFDPALAAHPYGLLYAGMDMNGGAMRKAATRETTGPLKAWLSEHKKNPYPTKAEKIMLAIITRMTLTQVSTWFANARRRLKKENKLSPHDKEGREDEDDDDDFDDTDSRREGNSSRSIGSDKRFFSDSDNEDINVDLSDNSDVDDDVMTTSDDARNRVHRMGSSNDNMTARIREGKYNSFGYAYGKDSDQTSSRLSLHQTNDHKPQVGLESHSLIKASPSSSAQTRPKIWSISEIISGPSSSSEASRHMLPQISPTYTTSPHQGTSKSSLTASATITRLTPPSATALISSSLSLTPFSTSPSSSSSPLSPPAFRPSSLIMGSPNLFSHRPEFSAFVGKPGLSIPTSCLNFNRESHTNSPIDLQKTESNRYEANDGGDNYHTNVPNNRSKHISTIQSVQENGDKTNTSDLKLNLSPIDKKHYPDVESNYRNELRARSLGHSSDAPFSGSPRKTYKPETSSTLSKTGTSSTDSPQKLMTQTSTSQDQLMKRTAHSPQNINANGHGGTEEALDLQTTKRPTVS